MKLIVFSVLCALVILSCVYLISGCSQRRDAKTEDIVYGLVAAHPNEDLTLRFSTLEGQEPYKWDIGELSRALARLIQKGRVVTTDKGVKVAEQR